MAVMEENMTSEIKNKPLIIKHKTPEGRMYVFDSLTDLFFEVDDVIFDIIDYYCVLPDGEIIEKLKSTHSREKLEKSLGVLKEQQKEYGLFSTERPSGMGFDCGEQGPIYEKYKESCNQLILEVTESCNLRCKYCAYSGLYKYQRPHLNIMMSRETAKKAVDWFLGISEKAEIERAITFYGGEPLLNFDLIKWVVDYIKEKGLKVHHAMTTNGTLLGDSKIVNFLIDNEVDILVSLDGPADVHDECRVFASGGGTHDVIMKNMKKIYEADKDYYNKRVRYTATLPYASRVEKTLNFMEQDHGFPLSFMRVGLIDQVDTDFYEVYGREKLDTDPFAMLFDEYCALVEKGTYDKGEVAGRAGLLNELFNLNFLMIHRRCLKKHDIMHMNGCCIPGQRRVFADVNGSLHACERIGTKYPLGNINDGSGFDMKKVQAFQDEYIKVSFEDCRECVIQNLCFACFKMAMKDGLMNIERKRENCKTIISNITNNLRRYIDISSRNEHAFDFLDKVVVI